MDNEQPHQELVKCVLVGDTAVGKTRLICARACNQQVSLAQLLATHVPTVWAIDQYRIYKDEIPKSMTLNGECYDTLDDIAMAFCKHFEGVYLYHGAEGIRNPTNISLHTTLSAHLLTEDEIANKICSLKSKPTLGRMVLERSWEVVDSVSVSLRLWDTFGDHEKDRRFAYGRSDVVLLCFSINNPISLRNCRLMWYPEIRRFCPNTPVLLVGCKNDLRFMYRDEAYLTFFRDRSPFVRATRKTDLVMPDEARGTAHELGISYYETSVLTYYGVNEVFENAIRAALQARRQQRFWQANLKKVQRPLLQAPFKPPPPPRPKISISSSLFTEQLHNLWHGREHSDIVLVVGSIGFSAHRFILAAASPAFYKLFTLEIAADITRSTSDSSMVSSLGEFSDDNESLLKAEQRIWRRHTSCHTLPPARELDHPVFQAIRTIQADGQTVVTLSKLITPAAIRQCLLFIYTGTIDQQFIELQFVSLGSLVLLFQSSPNSVPNSKCNQGSGVLQIESPLSPTTSRVVEELMENLDFSNADSVKDPDYSPNKISSSSEEEGDATTQSDILSKNVLSENNHQDGLHSELRQTAEFLELTQLLLLLREIQHMDIKKGLHSQEHYEIYLGRKLQDVCLNQAIFADIVFELDDGACAAHKAMLAARCDVMKAMFGGDFRESQAKVIQFPGVREYTFLKLLCYLYTDDVPAASAARCINLLELGNRLCLPRLVNLVEKRVIEDLERLQPSETIEQCLRLLEPVKLHNAHQLADWCMNHLCVNYNKLCSMSPRSLRVLHSDNQAYLVEHRWPPVWYLKDYDYYQKCLVERDRETKTTIKTNSGCLCFSRKSESDPALSGHL